jgi:hypothetical protein
MKCNIVDNKNLIELYVLSVHHIVLEIEIKSDGKVLVKELK